MEIKTETRVVRFIEYDGKRFYEDKKGYWLGQRIDEDGKPRRVRLHTYVWEKHYGPVPDGYDVHHIDRDPSNNEISNLIIMPESEHHAMHMADRNEDELCYILENYARPKAVLWHKSEEGRAWHKEQYKSTIGSKAGEVETLSCQYCGKEFQTPKLTAYKTKFCSNNCKSAYRRKAGIDNVTRQCVICGKDFVCNKYSRSKHCSNKCATITRLQDKTEESRHRN